MVRKRVVRRTIASRDVGVGSDEPIAWAPMSQGMSLVSVTGSLHVLGPEAIPINLFAAYGFSGYVMPVIEPEGSSAAKTTWDTMVTKAVDLVATAATEEIDYDWDTADSGPNIEPGELDPSGIFGIGEEVTKTILEPQLEFVSWANSRQGGWVAGAPDVYNPSDFKRFRSRRRITADEPSLAMLAVSAPSMTDVQESMNGFDISGAQPWGMLENLDEVMRFALISALGLTEAGAETPYADMAAFIQNLVAPDMSDESSTHYVANIWRVMCECLWVFELEGSDIPMTLDGR